MMEKMWNQRNIAMMGLLLQLLVVLMQIMITLLVLQVALLKPMLLFLLLIVVRSANYPAITNIGFRWRRVLIAILRVLLRITLILLLTSQRSFAAATTAA